MEKKRVEEIDIAKGIGILLVIIGHCFPDVSTPEGISVSTFRMIHDVIYTFHMPLMFFLAGFIAQRIFQFKTTYDKIGYIYDRFIRLMIPYFAIGLLYMPIKIVLSRFASQPFDIRNLGLIFFGENPDGGLWYLYDLFLIQVIVSLIGTKKNIKVLVPVSAVISTLILFLSLSMYRVDDAIYYLFFVLLGLLVGEGYESCGKYLSFRALFLYGVVFIASVFCCLTFEFSVLKVACGVLGTALILSISHNLQNLNRGGTTSILKYLGKHTMDIYVLHGLIMVAIRISLWSILKLDYYLCSVAMLLGGLFIPVLVADKILRKSKVLSLLFLGEK